MHHRRLPRVVVPRALLGIVLGIVLAQDHARDPETDADHQQRQPWEPLDATATVSAERHDAPDDQAQFRNHVSFPSIGVRCTVTACVDPPPTWSTSTKSVFGTVVVRVSVL